MKRSGFAVSLLVTLLAVGGAEARSSRSAAAPKLQRDDVLLKEAKRLGITEAVEASLLPRRAQQRLALAIMREARANGLDPLLVVAVIQSESSFNAYAVSPVGARGLMQVMPDTGAWLLSRRGQKLHRPEHLWDVDLNVELGTSYLAELIARFGTVEKALVAYNAGPTAARRILSGPDQGRRFRAGYPSKVLSEHRRLLALAEPADGSLQGQQLARGSSGPLPGQRVRP